jgi:LIVCS family branched-chain amino acid:cation transporter
MDMHLVTTGLAIFSMLFGAGNLIYPLMVGLSSGHLTWIGIGSFLISATFLPLLGLISMILFDGNYNVFFERLGKIPGQCIIFICMMIIGPVIAIPRITTLSFTMISPFVPEIPFINDGSFYSSLIFALFFLGTTFLATYKENRIITVLGSFISPILLASLMLIIVKGLFIADLPQIIATSPWKVAVDSFVRGYETLDLIGAIFFASIIVTLLQQNNPQASLRTLSYQGLKAGVLGTFCLAIIYIGMGLLGMYHGKTFGYLDGGRLFSAISFKILGSQGAILIAVTVLMACFSTSIALAAIIGEYIQKTIFVNRISYVQGLLITLFLSLPLSLFGLDYVLRFAGGPLVHILYPIIITITVCNLLHKLHMSDYIKIPTIIVTLHVISSYFFNFFCM